LLAIIIVAFVFTIGAGPGIVSDERTRFVNDFYGIDLNNQQDVRQLQNATMISRYVNGVRQYDDSQFQQQMLLRQVRLHLANTLAIPEPTEDELRTFISEKRNFQDDNGQFDKTVFSEFIDSMRGGPVIDEAFVLETLKQDFVLSKVDELFASPGFVSPVELAAAVARDNTVWSVEIAKLNFDTFDPEITVEEDALTSYFNENRLRYEIPDFYKVSYVDIDVSMMPTETEATQEELKAYFFNNRRIFADEEGAIKAAQEIGAEPMTDDAIFEILRGKVDTAYQMELKSGVAVRMANDLIGRLFEEEIAYQSEAFDALLAEYGLTLKDLPAFSADPASQPQGIVPTGLYRSSLRLDVDRYYSDVVEDENSEHFYISFLDETIPSRIPELAEVREKVEADYRADQKDALFAAKGEALSEALQTEAQSGGSIEIAATREALEFEKVEAFKMVERPQSVPFQILREIESLNSGETSRMITAGNFGYFIHVVEKTKPELDESSLEFTSVKAGLENYSAFARYQSLLSELVAAKLGTQRG
jgi:peptidyl-prolyl cis-trans isomerase D